MLKKLLRIMGMVLIVIIIINFILFALGKISVANFWMIIILIGLAAYFGMPFIKKRI